MKAIGFLCLLFVVSAQAPTQEEKLRAMKKQAQIVVDAMAKDDHEKLVEFTHPKVVEKLGGRKKMIETLEMISKKIRSQWPNISVKLQEPKNIVEHKGEWYGIVPFNMELKGKDLRVTTESFLIGISGDGGKNWTYMDAGNKSLDQIRQVLPDFPNELRLPQTAKPKLEKSE